ncbi:hypothetical protein EYF80_007267 [Liparis tanakae]|uniref:Uncharacterized protein n=1 Tax=Liparis tanakae TaxID=230148 RepID=A0A4Z2IYQ3_9TELE|nr:hypothetical protein EYF80_007267 [Liparis tanakae]
MGRRLAWRDGSAGETELWKNSCLIFTAPCSAAEPLSHAGFVLFLRTVGDHLKESADHSRCRASQSKRGPEAKESSSECDVSPHADTLEVPGSSAQYEVKAGQEQEVKPMEIMCCRPLAVSTRPQSFTGRYVTAFIADKCCTVSDVCSTTIIYEDRSESDAKLLGGMPAERRARRNTKQCIMCNLISVLLRVPVPPFPSSSYTSLAGSAVVCKRRTLGLVWLKLMNRPARVRNSRAKL